MTGRKIGDKFLSDAITRQAEAMRQFGYVFVTDEHVRSLYDEWVSGRENTGGIVGRFCRGAFDENPEEFGRPE